MNWRQSAQMAAKKIEELEYYNSLCKRDIKAYNLIIDGMIAGTLNPCDWCNDQEDCAPSDQGKGCKEWMLKFDLPEKGDDLTDDGEGSGQESESLSIAGADGRTGDQKH